MPDIVPATPGIHRPDFRDVDPSSLHVDEKYQRGLSERSVTLIRKIVREWSWSAFKPPITVEVDGALHVLDGQHTAVAAASHPGIETIPVVVVPAPTTEDRAAAFVRHNRDRVAVTPMQLHHSLLAAGDEAAQDVANVCARAGVTVLRNPPAMGKFNVGDTLAIAALGALVKRRFPLGARKVLDICVAAGLAPVSMEMIKAIDAIIHEDEYAGTVEPEALAATIRSMSPERWSEVAQLRTAHRMPKWKALTVVLYRNTRKKRRA
ncbi:hypothetical protein LC092_05330 [Stappia stellulata]|uniref:DUF6551 family protein n=1 Tax=Stappia stellulata TaxID=71235 RepID=UPI001CD65A64|nr:DUF6551 family protein [Stappia stellulata]MCA1241849.1 hypothetical protein [Stappia stellulata]